MLTSGSFEDRLLSWSILRTKIKSSTNFLDDLTQAYNRLIRQSIQYDPWNQKDWPTPWEIIYNNKYCEFTIILAMGYTLQYSARDSKQKREIWITKNTAANRSKYLLRTDNKLLGYTEDLSAIEPNTLPETEIVQKIFELSQNKDHNAK